MKQNKMKYQYRNSVIFSLVFLLIAHSAFALSPIDKVKEKVDEIISVVVEAQKNQTLNNTATQEKLWFSVDAIFDFSTLSRKALGKNWLAMNDEEQTEFVGLFRKLLGQVYLNKIKSYENQSIQYLKESFTSPETVEVFTEIESNGQSYDLNYRLIQRNGEWRIYDVTIEKVSLLSNYRSQFNDFLKKNTIQKMLSNLKTKVEEIDKQEK